jgi:hypothetical protein
MLSLPLSVRIFVALEATDMRNYAESSVMRSWRAKTMESQEKSVKQLRISKIAWAACGDMSSMPAARARSCPGLARTLT